MTLTPPLSCAVLACALFIATPALADPCEAPLPARAGAEFSGQVRYVGDGDSLCVGPGADPGSWIEVRLGDFDAPELHSVGGPRAKALLQRVALGRFVVCQAQRGRSGRVISHDRVIAVCRLSGVPISGLLRQAGAVEGGN